MGFDNELEAMSKVFEAVKDLDQEQQHRVLNWISSKLGISSITSQKKNTNANDSSIDNNHCKDFNDFATLPDLFAVANLNTEAEKALLVAAYTQIKEDKKELTSREINDALKHLGHGVSNITAAINGLVSRKPQLMIQTRKEGSTKQAQKKYKVTTEGLKEAKRIISGVSGEN